MILGEAHKTRGSGRMGRLAGCVVCLACLVPAAGCRSIERRIDKKVINDAGETVGDVKTSLGSVAEAMAGRKLSEEEKDEVIDQIRKDPEAQDAMRSLGETMSGPGVRIKYCPITGKRFASHLEECPVHHVPLEWVEP